MTDTVGARINTDEWLAELDRIAGPRFPVISDRGFTISELMAAKDLSYSTAERIVRAQLQAGAIEQIGVRPGRCGAKVYKIK